MRKALGSNFAPACIWLGILKPSRRQELQPGSGSGRDGCGRTQNERAAKDGWNTREETVRRGGREASPQS